MSRFSAPNRVDVVLDVAHCGTVGTVVLSALAVHLVDYLLLAIGSCRIGRLSGHAEG